MSKENKSLTALHWVFSLGVIAGVGFLMFGGVDILEEWLRARSASTPVSVKSMPPMPPVPAPAPAAAHTPPKPTATAGDMPGKSSSIVYEGARTALPMEEETKFFQRKEFLAGEGSRKHTLTYYLYAPAPPYPEGLTFPLVLVMHDVHGKAVAAQFLIEGQMPVKHPAFVVVPVLPFGKKWAMPQDFPEMPGYEPPSRDLEGLKDAVQLLNQLKANYPIDDKRVYAVGCSDGGFGAFGAALRYPDLFAASVPIAGGWTAEDAKGFAKVPLWIFHGAQDALTPAALSRGAASYINAYGGKANYIEVPNAGHDCENGQFYRTAMWDWMFSQHK